MATPDLPLSLRPAPLPLPGHARDLQRSRRDARPRGLRGDRALPEHHAKPRRWARGSASRSATPSISTCRPTSSPTGTRTTAGRALVRALIRSGHIDCFHSFGDLATTRAAGGALAGRAGAPRLPPRGVDRPRDRPHQLRGRHHAGHRRRARGPRLPCRPDLRLRRRVRLARAGDERGRPRTFPGALGGIFDPAHPLASARTLAKEMTKSGLARLGHEKYAMHPPNQVLRPARLRDGREVSEFLRANPFWLAVDKGETADGLAGVLVRPMLERLIGARGASRSSTPTSARCGTGASPSGPRPGRALEAWRACTARAGSWSPPRAGCSTTARQCGRPPRSEADVDGMPGRGDHPSPPPVRGRAHRLSAPARGRPGFASTAAWWRTPAATSPTTRDGPASPCPGGGSSFLAYETRGRQPRRQLAGHARPGLPVPERDLPRRGPRAAEHLVERRPGCARGRFRRGGSCPARS